MSGYRLYTEKFYIGSNSVLSQRTMTFLKLIIRLKVKKLYLDTLLSIRLENNYPFKILAKVKL